MYPIGHSLQDEYLLRVPIDASLGELHQFGSSSHTALEDALKCDVSSLSGTSECSKYFDQLKRQRRPFEVNTQTWATGEGTRIRLAFFECIFE